MSTRSDVPGFIATLDAAQREELKKLFKRLFDGAVYQMSDKAAEWCVQDGIERLGVRDPETCWLEGASLAEREAYDLWQEGLDDAAAAAADDSFQAAMTAVFAEFEAVFEAGLKVKFP